MKTLAFLEKLATTVHHDPSLGSLLCTQPQAIQQAYLHNDANALKSQLGDTHCLADRTTFVQLLA